MPAFGIDTPVVQPSHPKAGGAQQWLLWPALRYRVVSPLVHEQRLNMFQSAVLGLARAGFRRADEIGGLLGLQSELIDVVRADLKALAYLDRYDAITDIGRKALRDGFLDPTRTITTYVYQDVTTGSLWPASTLEPSQAKVTWNTSDRARVQLRTAGSPWLVSAFPVRPAGGRAAPDPPGHEQIVEAVARGEQAKRHGGGRNRRWDTPVPDRVVSRVSLVTSGSPVWIPIQLLLERRGTEDSDLLSWNARNPFTARSSTYLRKLVATRVQESVALRERIERFVGARSEALLSDYDLIDIAVRRRIAEKLEDRFTVGLREHKDLFELLTLLERDIDRARRTGDGAPELGDVARNAWRLHEAILRDVVSMNRPSNSIVSAFVDPVGPLLGDYCTRLGMPFGEQRHTKVVTTARQLRKALARPADAKTPELLAAAVVSAVHGDSDHPIRRLAAIRPNLLSELTNLSKDRNKGSHAQAAVLNVAAGEAAWQLAQDTVAAYLGLPLVDVAPTGKDLHFDGE